MIKPIPVQFMDKDDPHYDPIVWKSWFVKMHSEKWPWSNKHEPVPYPLKNVEAAEKSILNKHVWWALRNLGHNITHFEPIGLLGKSEYLVWKTPDEFGWEEGPRYWTRGNQRRKRFTGRGYGWQHRGNFRMSSGSKVVDGIVLLLAVIGIVTAIWQVVS